MSLGISFDCHVILIRLFLSILYFEEEANYNLKIFDILERKTEICFSILSLPTTMQVDNRKKFYNYISFHTPIL